MSRYMTVRVVDGSGRPKQGARVGLEVHRFMASGFKENQYTNGEGEVEFSLSDDSLVTLYVDGSTIRPTHRKPEAYVKLVV